MLCPKCGASIAEETLFCANCGTRLKSDIFYSSEQRDNITQPSSQIYAGFWLRFWAMLIV
ncbi:MAG: zinc ribbon domain-containing protein [Calditrichaeota bacterium]|nr:zinc ribbon domain-containing protein [Calditrichota bacterium]